MQFQKTYVVRFMSIKPKRPQPSTTTLYIVFARPRPALNQFTNYHLARNNHHQRGGPLRATTSIIWLFVITRRGVTNNYIVRFAAQWGHTMCWARRLHTCLTQNRHYKTHVLLASNDNPCLFSFWHDSQQRRPPHTIVVVFGDALVNCLNNKSWLFLVMHWLIVWTTNRGCLGWCIG